MTCPDENAIAQFVRTGDRSVEAHLDTCADCRLLVSELVRGEPDAAADEAVQAVELPIERDDRYTVLGEIGRGGQAKVMLAVDRTLGRKVALKQLLADGGGSPGDSDHDARQRRFVYEATITGRLTHPSIVVVHELARRRDGAPYYSMELVRGRTLAEALADCEGLDARLHYLEHALALARAIAYAHSKGVVHRDLKPANVMVGRFGETVVLDWGLAKVRGEPMPERNRDLTAPLEPVPLAATLDGATMGTPAYMSPEQARGDVDDIDETTDVWGLGAVLYAILTGRPPHEGASAAETIALAQRISPVPVRQRCPEVPAELSAIAERALAPDKADRYPTALALADELAAYLAGRRVRAYEYTSWELLRRFARRNRSVIAAASAVATAVVVALVAIALALHRERAASEGERGARVAAEEQHARAERALAQAFVERAEALARDQTWLSAVVMSAAALEIAAADDDVRLRARAIHDQAQRGPVRAREASVDWTSTIYATACDPVHGTAAALGDGRVIVRGRELARHGAGVRALAFAGDTLWSSDAKGEVRATAIATGDSRVVQRFAGGVWALAVDGDRVATGHRGGALRVLEGDRVVAEVDAHAEDTFAVAFTAIGLVSAGADGTLRVWDPRSLARRGELAGHTGWVYALAPSPDGRTLASGGRDGTVRLWDLTTRTELGSLSGSATAIAFAPDGRWLVSAGGDGLLRVWDPRSKTLRQTVLAHARVVNGLSFASASALVSGGQDGTLQRWSLAPDAASPWAAPGALDNGARLSADRTRLAAPMGGEGVFVVDVAAPHAGQRIATDRHVEAVAFLGAEIVTAHRDGIAMVRDARDGTVRRRLGREGSPLRSVAVAPDGGTIATGAEDGEVALWSAESGERLRVLGGHDRTVYGLAFSRDGRWLASAGWDRALLRTLAGEVLGEWIEHPSVAVDISADGTLLGIAGESVTVLDVQTGGVRFRPAGHAEFVHDVEFSADASLVATSSADGSVRVFRTDDGMPLTRFEEPEGAHGVAWLGPDALLVVAADRIEPRRWPSGPVVDLATALANGGLVLDGFALSLRR